ncbi:unnamed protein product [Candidula unifasciata]|uniref:Globin n=1 Tax=Candidula unifasciata TaxID=100452 RepID=A0A8S3YJP6_9EUPU|nr:unnamed protein product [Candidula unifasciata]
MGCGGSQKPAPPKVDDDPPDPTTGLTLKDVIMIENSWKIIGNRTTLKQNAVGFFLILFETYPHMQDRFVLFKDKTLDELRTSPEMKAHATSVFYALTSYVDNVDDPEMLVGLVRKISVSHFCKKIPADDFDKLRIVFLNFVKYLLGDKYTPEIEQAWDKLLRAQTAVFKQIEEEMLSKQETQEMPKTDI